MIDFDAYQHKIAFMDALLWPEVPFLYEKWKYLYVYVYGQTMEEVSEELLADDD